jgi:hypothetical protein
MYCVDTLPGKRANLHTCNGEDATQIVQAKH